MAQHDYNIANQTFPNTRTDINNALSAVASNNSGDTAPSTTFANQWFYETDTNLLQIRNEDNDAYITIAELDQTNDTVEYFKSDSIRTALIEFTDGDDAITIADGGGVTIASGSLDVTGAGDTGGIININSTDTAGASTDNIGRINFVGSDSSGGASGTRAAIETEVTGNFGSTQINFEVASGGASAAKVVTFSPTGIDINQDITHLDNGGNARTLYDRSENLLGNTGTNLTAASIFLGGTGSSNQLDDYEVGTFTPTLNGTASAPSGVSYNIRLGFYEKIGDIVHVHVHLSAASMSAVPGGALTVTGLPFTSDTTSSFLQAGSVGLTSNFATTEAPQASYINPNTTVMNFVCNNSSDGRNNLEDAITCANAMSGNELLVASATYRSV